MNFSILGPLSVHGNGQDITPTARKIRQVLAMLLVYRNKPLQTARIVDELWGESVPESGQTTVQTYVYKLRKQVFERTGAALLHTCPGGYLLEISEEHIDFCRFRALVRRGEEALTRADPDAATALLDEAIRVWQGPALVGLATGDVLFAYASRLNEERLRALEFRISAEMQLGRHRELVGELKQLVMLHPLHESFYRDLMVALSRSGRRYEALMVYQGLRTLLLDELGVEPSEPVRRLQKSLLAAGSAGLATSLVRSEATA